MSWTLVLGPVWRATDLASLSGVIGLAYPFGDVVIVFYAVLAIRGLSAGDRRPLWFLLAGLLAMAFSDSGYAYLSVTGAYATLSPHLVDAGWVAAYLAIGLAALGADGSRAHVAERAHGGALPLVSIAAPFAPVLIALALTAIEIRLGHRPDRVAWAMAFALVALVLVRQALMLLELTGRREPLS